MRTVTLELISLSKTGEPSDMPTERKSPDSLKLAALEDMSKVGFWLAYRATKSQALAEEAVQEAYLVLIKHQEKLQGEAELKSYFFTAVRGCASSIMRSEKRRHKREDAFMQLPLEKEHNEEKQDLARAARQALWQLPQEEREAVSLCCEQGFSWQAASKILGIPTRSVGNRVNRGLGKLRKALAQQGYSVATPLAVGTALGALPLPAIPATLTAALQNLAANPALAAEKAAKLSAKALSQTAAKKTATVWLAFGLTAGAAALAGGIWYWSNLPQNVAAIQQAEIAAQPPSESDVEVIYEDDFDGETLSDFWKKVEPAGQVTVNDKEYKSALVLRIAGPKAKVKLQPKVSVISKPIDLTKGIVEVVVRSGKADLYSAKTAASGGTDRIGLCDENGNDLNGKAYAGNTARDVSDDMGGGLNRTPFAERKFYILVSGDFLVFNENRHRFFGYFDQKPQSVRLQLYAQISDPSAYGAYCFNRVSVRVLQHLPEDIAREYADAVAKHREAAAKEKQQ